MSLSSFITEDLKSRILSGQNLPSNLSLIDLSNQYGVSITPVREAVHMLVAEGFVNKLPNKRLQINLDLIGTGHDHKPIEFPPMQSDWDEILLEEVMHESLRKEAVYLRESLFAERSGVGRSIIRQTFSRFAGAGLLEHIPRKGWLVHPFRAEDMEAYLEVREVLELKALELSKSKIDDAHIEAILDGELHALNNALHRYLIEKSGNRYIREFFTQYVARYYTKLFYYAAPEISVVDEMTGQHREILESLLSRSWPRAKSVLSVHIRAQKTVLIKLLDHEHNEMVAGVNAGFEFSIQAWQPASKNVQWTQTSHCSK